MRPDPPSRLRAIVDACVAFGNESEPWVSFMTEFRELIDEVAGARRAPHDFRDWFLSWVWRTRKLEALVNRLNNPGPDQPVSNPDEDIRAYLRTVVASGVGDRWREDNPRPPVPRPPRPDPDPDREERAARVRDAVARLGDGLRLPFWLQNLADLGPLPPDDLAAVAELAGTTPEEVLATLDRALGENAHRKYPVSTRLIGQLLGLPPDARGKYLAVSQRLKRAAMKLRQMLAPPEDPP